MRRINAKGFTLVELMIVVAIIALLAAIAIPNLMRARTSANEAATKANLKAWATSAEVYATDNSGNYPTAESDLTGATPSYLPKQYVGTTVNGYAYTATLTTGGYTVVATPTSAAPTAPNCLRVTTGAVMQWAAASGSPPACGAGWTAL